MGGAPAILPQPAGSQQSIADVVGQDDLTRWAQLAGVLQYFTAPVQEPAAPTRPAPLAVTSSNDTFSNLYAQLRALGVPVIIAMLWAAFWASLIGLTGVLVSFLARIFAGVLTPVAALALETLGGIRQGIDPQVGILAQEVLTEFLGVEVGTQNIPFTTGGAAHIDRATAIGGLLFGQLEKEFLAAVGGTVQPSTKPAETFSGLAVNFGLASGIMGLIGGLVPVGHVDEVRELGEEVATNIGLGRLVRRALTPLVQILVANPATWALNIKYRPTQFKEADLVNPFTATTLDHTQLYNAMHLLGYSDDKIAAFIEMHQKKLTPADVQLLINWGFWSAEDGAKYVQRQGWPSGLAGNVLQLEGFREVRPWITKEIDVLLSEVGDGQITVNEFAQVIDGFALSAPEKSVIVALANYRAQKTHLHRPHQLSGGELFYAFAAGIVTASDLTDRWTAQGLTQADQDIRLQLWLLHLNRLHELEQERQKVFQEKQQAFLQKLGGAKKVLSPPVPPVPPFPLG
jgi:hypothetical protein